MVSSCRSMGREVVEGVGFGFACNETASVGHGHCVGEFQIEFRMPSQRDVFGMGIMQGFGADVGGGKNEYNSLELRCFSWVGCILGSLCD